jgi:hypothetical protein
MKTTATHMSAGAKNSKLRPWGEKPPADIVVNAWATAS